MELVYLYIENGAVFYVYCKTHIYPFSLSDKTEIKI